MYAMLMGFAAPLAHAEPAVPPPPDPIELRMRDNGPVLLVRGEPETPLRASFRVRLGGLSSSWDTPATRLNAPQQAFAIAVPSTAYLHPRAQDYVTDLIVEVTLGGKAWYTHAYLAWPEGPDAAVVIWDEPTMRDRAPQGVVNPELRRTDLRAGDRLIPALARPGREGT